MERGRKKIADIMIIGALVIMMILWGNAASVLAQTDPPEDEAPAFDNPAQADHAENLAEAWVETHAEDIFSKDPDVQAAEKALEEAQKALENANANNQRTAQAAAAEALAELEEAKSDALAEALGEQLEDIAGHRADGMGWGEIAHLHGFHPGLLGRGHTKGNTAHTTAAFMGKGKPGTPEDAIAGATARDHKNGLARGHNKGDDEAFGGVGHGKDKGGPGATGKADHKDGKSNNGKSEGNGNGRGNSEGKGGSGKH